MGSVTLQDETVETPPSISMGSTEEGPGEHRREAAGRLQARN